MNGTKNPATRWHSRREFLTIAAGSATAVAISVGTDAPARAQSPRPAVAHDSNGPKPRPNILFIFTDQERYQRKLPPGLSLPAHERLQRKGVTFHNHYCPAAMCTSSRSVLLTGLQTVDTRMFDNTDVPWVSDMSTKIPTIGHLLRKSGYYTAYKGKWHLSRKFDVADRLDQLNKDMEKYGFADFHSPGDIMAHALGGYQFDHLIAGSAVTWLRRRGEPLSADGKPWALFISLVNPHDIMYFNTDLPGQKVQDTGALFMHAATAPNSEMYTADWDVPIPKTLTQPFDAPGRPKAHGEFNEMWSYVLGRIPPEEERWRRFNNFYINSLRSVDMQIEAILRELDALRLADRTIVIFTSDHGEMAGAHGLRGKGPFAYEEKLHLPLYLVHPDVKGGQDCRSLTGHIDLVPTLLAMAGADATKRAEFAGRGLPGKDLTPLLTNPGAAGLHAAREGVLYAYSGLATNDSGIFRIAAEAKAAGKKPALVVLKQRYLPDLKKRGSVRTVFDGHYKFSRYFSPLDHNQPATIDELYATNDVELFDLDTDLDEMANLAADKTANNDLVLAMNAKLAALIKAEIGIDDGRELPNIPLVTWTIDRVS
jgi:arylsulfatase A-like enzyme